MAVLGLAQVHISVRDLQMQVGFYRDALGLPLVVDAGNAVFLDCGGTRLYFAQPESEEFRSNPLLYLGVDDIDAMVETLRGAGVTVRSDPHRIATLGGNDLWLAFFIDPEGNTVGLMEERPAAG